MMEKKKKRILFGALAVILFIGIASAGTMYYYLFTPQFHPQKTVYIYIDRDDTTDSIYNKIKAQGKPNSFNGFKWMSQWRDYSGNIHTLCDTSRRERLPCIQPFLQRIPSPHEPDHRKRTHFGQTGA